LDRVEAVDAYFEDNRPIEGHANRSLRAGAVSIAARWVNTMVQIACVLILARLLSPEDYGLVAMVVAFTGFAPGVVDLGTRDAIVQRTRITGGEVSALFWFTIGLGASLALATALSAPLIARFYGEPRLTMIAIVFAATFIACALSVQHQTLLRRVLMFEQLALIDVLANILSALAAITAAFLGAGYWALVVRPIATPTFVAAGVWLTCRWTPGRPTVTEGVKDSFKFGANLTGFMMTDFAARSGDRVAIGYRIGAAGLGQYQNALFVYDNLLDLLVFPLHSVAVASLSKLRHNLSELRTAWSKALSTVAFYAMPVFGLLAVTSREVVVYVLGAKWASAGLLLSVLALRGIPNSIEHTAGWLHVTAGRTDRLMRWGVLAVIVQFAALFVGLPYGPMGVVLASTVALFILFVPAVAYAGQPLGITPSDVINALWRQLAASLISAALAFLLRWTILSDIHPMGRMLVAGLVYLMCYSVIVIGILRLRAPLVTGLSLLRSYTDRRLPQPYN
jgi:PST family polysaccharide transporter